MLFDSILVSAQSYEGPLGDTDVPRGHLRYPYPNGNIKPPKEGEGITVTSQDYEYLTERFDGIPGSDEHTHLINAIAAHGWRLVSTSTIARVVEIMYFERPVKNSDE